MRATRCLLLLLLLLPLPLQAQQPRVLFRGRGDITFDGRIRALLRDTSRTLWTRDTLIARTDTVRRALLVVGATVRVEGVLQGDIAAVGADFFLRPRAQVLGPVLNVAGGWYASDLATVSGALENRPDAPYAIERMADAIVIRGTTEPRVLAIDPLVPGYDRVSGLSAGAGVKLLLPALGRLESTIGGWGAYRSQRGQIDGGAQARFSAGTTALSLGAERTAPSNEDWIRSPIGNSIYYLVAGTDIRDYYEADRAWLELRHSMAGDQHSAAVWLRGQIEDARSLPAGQPWTLFGPDSVRPNRPIDAGRISSILAGTTLSWRRSTFETTLAGHTEFALDALQSDFTFSAYRLDLDWAMAALGNHTLEIKAHLQGPLPFIAETCSDCPGPAHTIPRQRWSHLGGSGTLYTFSNAAFQGSRVAFIETTYGIPLGSRFRMPFLGIPSLDLLHLTGMAWNRADTHRFEQNLGLQLSYNVLGLRLVTDPTDVTGAVNLALVFRFPRRAYPWEPPGGFF